MSKCPISSTHKRLNQTLFYLNEAIRTYQDPDKFIANINNLIQSMRNITFILQSEKGKIVDFDVWYENWRVLMKKDNAMKWLVTARNLIVKQGDLETKSLATFYIKTYDKNKLLELSFDPFSKLDDVIGGIIKSRLIKIPEHIKKDAILTVERRWSVDEYPKAEILDLLIYCLDTLIRLVIDAHEVIKCDYISCEHNKLSVYDIKRFLHLMHNKIEEKRVLNLRFSDYSTLRLREEPANKTITDSDAISLATKRYGNIREVLKNKKIIETDYPFNMVNHLLETAKHLLSRDGALLSMAFVYIDESCPPIMISSNPDDQTDKYLISERIAKVVEENRAIGVLTINEAWYITLNEYTKEKKRASENSAKKESISIMIATIKKTKTYSVPFKISRDGAIVFSDLDIYEGEQPFFNPVYGVWRHSEHSGSSNNKNG